MSEILCVRDKVWDSDFFNLKIGHITVEEKSPVDFNTVGYDLVYVFSDTPIARLRQQLIDVKVILRLNLEDFTRETPQIHYLTTDFNIREDSYTELESLAIDSGKLSRFRRDHRLGAMKCEELYKKWIYNITSSNDDVIVIKNENELIGFVSVNYSHEKKIATIGLVAIKEEYRGQGLGKVMMNAILDRCLNQGMEKVDVATQQINVGAVKLYERVGFTDFKTTYIYHLWCS